MVHMIRNLGLAVGLTWSVMGIVGCAGPEPRAPSAVSPQAPVSPQSEQGKPVQVKMALTAAGANYFLPYMAKEVGIFEKNGLNVELVTVQSSPVSAAGLLSGELQFAGADGSMVVQSNMEGSGIVILMGFQNRLDYSLFTRPDITSAAQLKGGRVGITRYGSTPDFVARLAVKKLGLEPEKDVAIVQLGNVPERIAALESGAVESTVLTTHYFSVARKMGFYELKSLEDVDYQSVGIVATRSFIESNQDTVRRMVRALVEALHFHKTQKETATQLMGPFLRLDDREFIEDSYDVARKSWPQVPYPSIAGLRTIIEELSLKSPQAADVRPEELVDVRFVRELEQAGFIRQLYGQ